MNRTIVPLVAAALALAACDGNPFGPAPTPPPAPPGPVDPGGIDSTRVLPPGTASPSRDRRIVRYEPTGTDSAQGNGFVTDVSYDSTTDTFTVDNLGFDGDNRYTRGVRVGSLGPYAVYENADVFNDPRTGAAIGQFTHRALYGVSPSGQTEFAIVRTGAYTGYGFGGFVYQRNGTVVLPTSGQAAYSGAYAGLRDFEGRGGLEYATGDMVVAIDFNDFNRGNAVQGQVFNRAIFDINGRDITTEVITALSDRTGVPQTALPTLLFRVGPGVMDRNGEIVGEIDSSTLTTGGAVRPFETGKYYAVVSGANATEIVGVIVVEADDPRYTGVKVRETGGFLLSRP
jgi:hypothetical protein